jgi:hypothetical protein
LARKVLGAEWLHAARLKSLLHLRVASVVVKTRGTRGLPD